MALHSAEFPFLIPALAIPRQNCFPMSVSMLQFGEKLPVLPLWEIGKPAKTETRREYATFQSSDGSSVSVFCSDDRVLLGLIAASLE
jgi:hypothetical protein